MLVARYFVLFDRIYRQEASHEEGVVLGERDSRPASEEGVFEYGWSTSFFSTGVIRLVALRGRQRQRAGCLGASDVSSGLQAPAAKFSETYQALTV